MFEGHFDGPTNMARDAALLEQAELGRVAWRVYGWDGPWVSLGRSQSADTAILPNAPVNWVKRPTGGRAVLHGHDVTLGLGVPLSLLRLGRSERSVRAIYRAAIQPIVGALCACGVAVELAEDRVSSVSNSDDCFAGVSPNDIVHSVSGEKACGCALRVVGAAVLVQCSIPACEPLVEPGLVYREPSPVRFVTLGFVDFAHAFDDLLRRNSWANTDT
ncbi:MAG: hypothetical protein ABL962_08290 [Fimbriimonadaceae bacterium]